MRLIVTLALTVVGAFLVAGWFARVQPAPYAWQLPPGFPAPSVPDGNPMTVARVELGRHLFYDRRLSLSGDVACASCHVQALGFTDGRPRSPGATGELTQRNAMSLINVAYNSTFDWANPNVTSLEHQMLTPLFGEEPVEMGLAGMERDVLRNLADDERYRTLFRRAFPTDSEPFTWPNLIAAIASFVRSIVSHDAPYDRYLSGDVDALSESAVRGLELFLSEDFECFHCHGGFNFTDSSTHDRVTNPPRQFHNTALYDVDGHGAYPAPNRGVYELSGAPIDMGRFKAPTLRNIAVTSPYMHDGSIETLSEVLDHYANGGRAARPDSPPPNRSEFVRGFELSDRDRADLLAFLASLTDDRVLTDARWSDPFAVED